MKQRAIIYTTSQGTWIHERLPFIIEKLNTSEGRTVEKIDVKTISAPSKPQTIRDKEGDVRFTWDWFDRTFQSDEYDVVVFHFTSYYKKKWGLSNKIKGTYHKDHGDYFDFWLCADKDEQSKNYGLDEFTRVFLHEWLHGDSYMAGVPDSWKKTPREWVHHMDYNLKMIDTAHELISYKRYTILSLIYEKLSNFLKKYAGINNT